MPSRMETAIAAGGGGVAIVAGSENRRFGVVVVGEESVNDEDVPQAQRSAVREQIGNVLYSTSEQGSVRRS